MIQRRSLPRLARGIHISFLKDAPHSLCQFVRVPSRTFANTIWKPSNGTSQLGSSPIGAGESSTALKQSMHHITIAKLAALSKQHQSYETEKANILQTAASEDDPVESFRSFLMHLKTTTSRPQRAYQFSIFADFSCSPNATLPSHQTYYKNGRSLYKRPLTFIHTSMSTPRCSVNW